MGKYNNFCILYVNTFLKEFDKLWAKLNFYTSLYLNFLYIYLDTIYMFTQNNLFTLKETYWSFFLLQKEMNFDF